VAGFDHVRVTRAEVYRSAVVVLDAQIAGHDGAHMAGLATVGSPLLNGYCDDNHDVIEIATGMIGRSSRPSAWRHPPPRSTAGESALDPAVPVAGPDIWPHRPLYPAARSNPRPMLEPDRRVGAVLNEVAYT
jgi:hypothetical protein